MSGLFWGVEAIFVMLTIILETRSMWDLSEVCIMLALKGVCVFVMLQVANLRAQDVHCKVIPSTGSLDRVPLSVHCASFHPALPPKGL